MKFPRQYFCFTFEIEGLLREFVAFFDETTARLHFAKHRSCVLICKEKYQINLAVFIFVLMTLTVT